MTLLARLTTLLLVCWALGVCCEIAPARADERSSSLKVVSKPRTRATPVADETLAAAPNLSPPPPAQPPPLGDEILSEPLVPDMRRDGPLQPSRRSGSPPPADYYEDEPQYAEPQRGDRQYAEDPRGYDDSHYGPAPHGGHLQRHAERVRNYIDNRPRQLPLQSESWLNKPYALSYFVGGLWLDNPINGVVGGDVGFTYGGRFSWDFGPKWGIETRIGGADVGVTDKLGNVDLAPANIFFTDIDWLWYFTGDTRWRPFVLIGTGLFDIDYSDSIPLRHHATVLQMPLGVGLKYRHSTRIAMRIDLIDNITFASGPQDTMHNWSLTAGIEARFGGGRKRNYWPWNPSREWW